MNGQGIIETDEIKVIFREMYWKLFVSLLPHLLVCLARSITYENVEDDVAAVGSLIREVRQPAPLKFVAGVKDLMSAGNAPKSQDTKKPMKNASGMFSIANVSNRIHYNKCRKHYGLENHSLS